MVKQRRRTGVPVGKRKRPQAAAPKAKAKAVAQGRQLDAAALRYRALLLDPCNAELTSTVYAGLGTGQYRRYRVILGSAGTSIEGTYVFQLGTNLYYEATHVATTAGTSYTFGPTFNLINGLPANANVRCLAGCVKVRYVGPELDRKGTIGMAVFPGQFAAPGVSSNALADLARCPFVTRFGEVAHEVKWVPSQADEEFHVVGSLEQKCTSIVINYRGVPATTLQFEITLCLETEALDAGQPLTSTAPASKNTLNHVLQSLGPVSSWAYNTVLTPTIKSVYNAAMNTPITGTFAKAAAAGLMSL